jgi:hypothetical protein
MPTQFASGASTPAGHSPACDVPLEGDVTTRVVDTTAASLRDTEAVVGCRPNVAVALSAFGSYA